MNWTEKSKKNFLDHFCKKYKAWVISTGTTQRYVSTIDRLCNTEVFFKTRFPELFEESKKECKIGNEFLPYYERVEYIIQQFQPTLLNRYPNKGTRGGIETAIRRFTEFIWTFFDGSCFADEYMSHMTINTTSPIDIISQIVAGTSILLPLQFINNIKQQGNIFANASGELKYYRDNVNKKGSPQSVTIGGFTYPHLIADDNTRANTYLKQNILKCVGLPVSLYTLFVNYIACHIWAHPDDPRYYDNLQNLALVPSFLAGLTDHNTDIKEMLRLRAYNLYEFCEYYDSAQGANTPNSKCNVKKLNKKAKLPNNWRPL